MKTTIDLRQIASALVADFPAIQALWLFGSRRHRTRSIRSDIDVLLVSSAYLKASDVRRAIRRHCPALDLFLADGGKAISCMNDSFVEAASFDELRQKLDAVCIWSEEPTDIDEGAPFEQELRSDIAYIPTVLDGNEPRIGHWGQAVDDYFKQVEADRLPTKPFLGDTPVQVAKYLLEICADMVAVCELMVTRKTKADWKPALNSEYDFQDAFFFTVKPWLRDLSREEILLQFDDQEKVADFALLQGRVAIEMKYVSDKNTKAAVVKTLDGLARFYKRNPRVQVLLFLIAATSDADVDAAKWESEFSLQENGQSIITRVYAIG